MNDSVENSCNHCLLCEEFLECRVPDAVPFKVSPGVNAPFVSSARRHCTRDRWIGYAQIFSENTIHNHHHTVSIISRHWNQTQTQTFGSLGPHAFQWLKTCSNIKRKFLVNCLSVHYIILQIIIKNPNILPDSKGLFGFLFSPYIKPGCGLLQFLDQKLRPPKNAIQFATYIANITPVKYNIYKIT